jgi:hypothetical protein
MKRCICGSDLAIPKRITALLEVSLYLITIAECTLLFFTFFIADMAFVVYQPWLKKGTFNGLGLLISLNGSRMLT